jgi:hypothetical protein
MSHSGVNLLILAARVAHLECKAPNQPVNLQILTRAQKLALREKKMIAADLPKLEQQIVKTISKLASLHKLEDKMDPCEWRQMVETLVSMLKYLKSRHLELELLLRRLVLEPQNDQLLWQV